MMASKKTKGILTWVVMLAMIVSLFASFPAYVQAAAPTFLGVVGTRDPKATPIRTAKELANINNDLNGNFYLANDIDLAGVSNWTPIGDDEEHPFTGKFDGQGHVIKSMKVLVDQTKQNLDLNMNVPLAYAGLFGFTRNAEIKNTGVMDAKITAIGSVSAGGIVGRYLAVPGKPISNCFFIGEIQITPCYGEAYVGGIVGIIRGEEALAANNQNEIVDSYNEGKISVSYGTKGYNVTGSMGGIAGSSLNLTMKNCYNKGEISYDVRDLITAFTVGGLVGETNNLRVSDCYNSGKINTKAVGPFIQLYVGGLSGSSNQEIVIDRCYNIGSVKASLTRCDLLYNNGDQVYVGGLLGQGSYNSSYSEDEILGITNSYNKGSVTAEYTDVAGVTSIEADAGGIVGHMVGSLHMKNTYNNGNVSSVFLKTSRNISGFESVYINHSAAGGLLGTVRWAFTPATLVDCYNTGNVEAKSCNEASALAGGLAGYLNNVAPSGAKIETQTCYNAGTVKASYTNGATTESEPIGKFTHFGGLLGYGKTGTYKFNSCYYLKPAKGQAVGDRYGDSGFENVKALTLAQIKVQASFVGFDFKHTWKMSTNAGYPVISVR